MYPSNSKINDVFLGINSHRKFSASKYKVKIGCKDMEGREQGPSTERIKVHRNLKSKSAESRSIVKIG